MGRAILSLHLDAIADALQIPEGYKLLSIHYDAVTQWAQLLVGSDLLEEPVGGGSLSHVHLMVTVDHAPPEYRKITTRIEKGY